MTQQMTERFGRLATPHLAPGEQLLDMLTVVPVAGSKVAGVGAGAAVGNRLSRMGSVRGGEGSVAATFPKAPPAAGRRLVAATDQRLMFLVSDVAGKEAQLLWWAPRDAVLGVQRTVRLQLMARFRLHFADGSSVAVFTFRRRNIEAMAQVLGAYRPPRR